MCRGKKLWTILSLLAIHGTIWTANSERKLDDQHSSVTISAVSSTHTTTSLATDSSTDTTTTSTTASTATSTTATTATSTTATTATSTTAATTSSVGSTKRHSTTHTSKVNDVDVKLRNSRCKMDWDPYEYRRVYWSPVRVDPVDTKYSQTKGVLEDPFLMSQPIFPEKPHTWKLDCDSGLAHFDCFTEARSVCDAFCTQQCYQHFHGHYTQQELVDALQKAGSDGCVYRIQEVVVLKASICRTELNYAYEGDGSQQLTATVYLVEPDWSTVSLVNYRRLRKAALTIPLAGKYHFSPSIPTDFGNFIKATDLFDSKTCHIPPGRVTHYFSSLLMDNIHRTHFGAVYSWEPMPDSHNDTGIYTNDIFHLLKPSALASLGGLPKQFLVWWPGKQPLLAGHNGSFSEEASLKLIYQLPPSRYFSGKGMFTIDAEHCRIKRPAF